MTTLLSPRHIAVSGVFNVRDLGGYTGLDGRTTRWGVAFRADGVNRADESGLATLAELGLRNVVDLRTDRERDEHGVLDAGSWGGVAHHRPVIERTWDQDGIELESTDPIRFLADRYLEMLDQGAAAIAATVRLLADPDEHGTLFHCAAGKDRTGVTAMTVLSLVGVSRTDVIADYALSAPGMELMEDWVRANRPDVLDRMMRQPKEMRSSPAPAMELLLAEIDGRWGSVEGWVREATDLDHADITALRTALLDD